MQEIFITGHRNPDMDSICASWAYAQLKNKIDPATQYNAIRCGHLNAQTKYTLKALGVTAPRLEKDVYPRVKDILADKPLALRTDAPIFEAVKKIHDLNISVIPVFDGDDRFAGLVSINEISDFLIAEQIGGRPRYRFDTRNFDEVLPGFCYKEGEEKSFDAAIMIGAMPYEVSVARIQELLPDKPLLVVGQRERILDYAVQQQFPAIVLTGIKEPREVHFDFNNYRGTVFVSRTDTAETLRLLRLSTPISSIMDDQYPLLTEEHHFDEAKEMLVNTDRRGLPVFSAQDPDKFLGVVTRRSFIDRPRRKVIMVDHNEASQSIRGIEHADILEIIDHHRLGVEKTKTPIYVAAKPVGSTCTIVYQHYLQQGIPVDGLSAQVLLAGIISDTVILKSPTTTEEDRRAAVQLANIAGRRVEEFGEEIFSHTAVLSDQDPETMIKADFKEYQEWGCKIGIGQVEVSTFQDLEEVLPRIREALEKVQREQQLHWTMLLVSNVFREHSKLICTPYREAEEKLVFTQEAPGLFDLPEILSRKKQVLPELLRVVEELNS
ncbi:MAG TPA: putative manganese-dependent inorganic diphosphatase [Sediminispirochaeta sp.]|nr:putative manganese-dependent inorganic diphosphatase [Sediminispirochaeta sp.]